MAPMATTSNKAVVVLVVLALLPLSTLSSRSGPSAHHGSHGGHGHKRSPPPAVVSSPPPAVIVTPPPAAPPSPAAAAAALVRATCNSTTYYDVCVSALGADPSSATADVRGLSAIAISAAAVNASGGEATAAALANGTTTAEADGQLQALLRTCAAKYGQARDALGAARDSIAEQDYDYASVHVSAAAEYPRVCRALFRRQRPGAYPAVLQAREEALGKLCSVALDIIAMLSNSS